MFYIWLFFIFFQSASSGTDDPFKKPLGQGGFKPGPGLAPLSSSKGTLGSLGHVDLGTVNISNQYEEEEESDSEEKSDEVCTLICFLVPHFILSAHY